MMLFRCYETLRNAFRICVAGVSVLFCGAGCLSVNFTEPEPVLTLDREQINVASDMLSGEAVMDSVIVRSNRSWDAEIVPAVDWIRLETREFEDLEGITREVPLRMTFENNMSEYPRVASLMITTQTGMETVKIVQSSLLPQIKVESASEIENLHHEGAECRFHVLSNIDWTVSLGDKSEGLELSVERVSAEVCDTLKVSLPENLDFESGKYADLVFSVNGGEDVVRRITQSKALPYFRINGVTGGEEILPSIGGTRTISLKTNLNWTLAVKDNAAESVTFSKEKGGAGESDVMMTFLGNPEFDARREFTASFTTDKEVPEETTEWTFTQERGGLLRFLFAPEYASVTTKWFWPFYCKNGVWPSVSLSIGKPTSGGEEYVFTSYSGHVLKLYSNYGFVFGTSGIRFGYPKYYGLDDYFEFPAIEGRSLVQVNWVPDAAERYSSLMPRIVSVEPSSDSSADPVVTVVGTPEGGDFQDGVRTWRIAGEKSKAYRLMPTADQTTHAVKIIECIYE